MFLFPKKLLPIVFSSNNYHFIDNIDNVDNDKNYLVMTVN